MDQTPKIALPLVPVSQGGGDLLHNDAIMRAQHHCFLTVKSRTTSAEPASPSPGDAYILPADASGDHWSGHGQLIALYESGWVEDVNTEYIIPKNGMTVYVEDEDVVLSRVRGYWVPWDYHIRKPEDTDVSTSTLTEDPHLSAVLKKNSEYVFKLCLFCNGDAAADWKGTMNTTTVAASPDFVFVIWSIGLSTFYVNNSASTRVIPMIGTTFPSQCVPVMIHGTIKTEDNNVRLFLEWARNSLSFTPSVVREGSWMAVQLASVEPPGA
jgi:hypothetical protein